MARASARGALGLATWPAVSTSLEPSHILFGQQLALVNIPSAPTLNVNYSNFSFVDAQGNAHRQVGSYTNTDGQTRTATDVGELRQAANSQIWRLRA